MKDQFDDSRLADYLLGRSRPEDRDEIEQRYMSDPGFLAELQAVERDLIDQFVRGEIADRQAFEAQFLNSPARRERVEFARALMDSASPVRATIPVREPARYRPWQLAAAAVIVVAAGALLWVSNRPGVVDQQVTSVTPPAPPDSAATAPKPQLRVVTLTLSPTLVRSSGSTPVAIIGDASELRLVLELETGGYPSYQMVIRSADGNEILRQAGLKPESQNTVATIAASLPASRLAADDYLVTVSGVTSSGAIEELGGYSFRVQLRR